MLCLSALPFFSPSSVTHQRLKVPLILKKLRRNFAILIHILRSLRHKYRILKRCEPIIAMVTQQPSNTTTVVIVVNHRAFHFNSTDSALTTLREQHVLEVVNRHTVTASKVVFESCQWPQSPCFSFNIASAFFTPRCKSISHGYIFSECSRVFRAFTGATTLTQNQMFLGSANNSLTLATAVITALLTPSSHTKSISIVYVEFLQLLFDATLRAYFHTSIVV